jgi:hypothetical protein
MRRIRFSGLCLAGVCAVFAATSASASAALPEFSGPFPKAFTSTSGASTLETVKGTKFTCKADTNTGEITGPKEGHVTIKFTGCESSGLACNSSGAAPGEVITNVLTVTLLYTNRERKTVGLQLSSPPTGAPFMEFSCGAIPVSVRGSVTGGLTPVNKPVKPPLGRFTLKFAKAKGLEVSVGGPVEGSRFTSTDKLKFGEVVEVKA